MKTSNLLQTLQRAWRPRPLVWALALAGVATHALVPGAGEARAAGALPTGLNVVQGQASVVQAGQQMTVTNSAGAVLNWQSFNIGASNIVRFEQPNASSKVLNRVVGNNASQIFGKLSSNGEVWLVNPNGVLFGRDARIDVKGLVATTLNIGNDDWRAGRYSLSGGADNQASIVNQGELLTSTGGRVFLLAGAGGVRNEGLITAPDGQVTLAAGASIELVDGQTRNLAVRVQAPQGEVLNLGSLSAGGGRVDLAAAMVNQQGFVRAESLAGSGGQIVMTGSEGVNLAAGSVTSAAGASGGQVQVDGGRGTTMLAGEVNVTGSAGQGGDALLLGRQVGLLDGALVDASGAAGGGRVRVGGGLQGKDTSVTNARAVFMGQGAQVKADATGQGDGGTVILWSNEATRAYGSLSARGGAQGGDGGFIETSGGWLDAQPASGRPPAALGKSGVWLLDPNNLVISNSTFSSNVSGGPNFTTTGNNAVLMASTITTALNAGSNVVITTADVLGPNDTGPQDGDITISGANISSSSTLRNSLTINASRHLTMQNSSISSNVNAAPLDVTFSAANGTSGIGAISIANSSITTRGGNINLGGAVRAVGPNITSPRAGAVGRGELQAEGIGVSIVGSRLDAGAGNVTIVGQSVGNNQFDRTGYGVLISDIPDDGDGGGRLTSITGRDIDIYGWVDSNSSAARHGVHITGNTTSINATHSLNITGLSNSTSFNVGEGGWEPIGVFMDSAIVGVRPVATDPTASLTINGTMNDAQPTIPNPGFGRHTGVWMTDAAVLQATGGAQVQITGVDQMNAPAWSAAVVLDAGTNYDFALAGPVRVDGNTRLRLGGSLIAPTAQSFTATAGDLLLLEGTITGSPNSLALTGLDISLSSANMFVGATSLPTLTMTATRNIDVFNSVITAQGELLNINLVAAAGGSGNGSVSIDRSDFYSGSGDISIGGGTIAAGPNITSPQAGAVAGLTSQAGVFIADSRIDAGFGTLRVSGQAAGIAEDGRRYGVLIQESVEEFTRLSGRNVEIFGWVDSNDALTRTGVYVGAGAEVLGFNSVSITGVANSTVFHAGNVAPIGVHIDGAVAVDFDAGSFPQPTAVRPTTAPRATTLQAPSPTPAPTPAPTAALRITGTTNDGARTGQAPDRYGVLITENAFVGVVLPDRGQAAARVVATGGLPQLPPGPAALITGTDLSANDEVSVRMASQNADFNAASSLSIQGNHRIELAGTAYGPQGGAVDVRAGSTLALQQFQLYGGPDTVSLWGDQRLLASGSLNFEYPTNVTLRSAEVRLGADRPFDVITLGTIRVLTDRYITEQVSALTSSAAGTAIAIAGYDGASGITTLQSSEGPATMDTPNGRWLIYAVDDSISRNGLNYSFSQYNMTYPAEPTASGSLTENGLVFQQAPVLTLSSPTTITKPFDGNTNVTTTGITFTLTGLRPGHGDGDGFGNPTLSYASPAVQSNQLLTVGGYEQPAIFDGGERPVYGYTTQFDVRGSITAPPPAQISPLPEGMPEIEDSTRLYRQALPPLPRGPEGTRALDALQSLRVDPSWLSMTFGELDLSSMSRDEIAALLEARRQYKMQILAVGRERLSQDPSLADVPACQTARQSETGRCLVSAELLAAIDAGGETASINAPGPAPAVPTVAAAAAAAAAAAPVVSAPAPARPPVAAPVPAPVAAAPAVPVPAPAPAAPAAAAPAPVAAAPAPRPASAEPRTPPPRVRIAAKPVLEPPPIPSARTVQQASIPQIQRKIAVLVGIDNYVDERIPALENARRDVDAVARILEQRLGYETLIVRDAGREAMVGLLNRLALQVRPQDSVVVYYAGHGTVIDGTSQGYWIPATADAERPETWISNRDIGKLLGSLRASQVVLISDSCFSGSLVGDKKVQASSTTDARAMLTRRATLVMSSGGDEPVADGSAGGHSPFSNSLMATLQGLDNWRVGGNVFDKVRDDVTKRLPQTPRYGPARDARSVEGADYLFEQRQLGQR